MDVSIIIVNYNTRDLLKNCLISIYKHTTEINFEVIVSDNGSVDGSIEMLKQEFPQVILIENNANLGFGTANNRGLAIAKGKYIFYLNSDTVLLNNAVKMFYDYWENSPEKDSIGALGCNLLDKDGNVTGSWAGFPEPHSILIDTIRMNYGLLKIFILGLIGKHIAIPSENKKVYLKKVGDVDYIFGADLFLMNDKYAYYDEKIWLYTEETDLQFQLMLAEKKRLLIDGPEIIHLEEQSSITSDNQPFEGIVKFSARWKRISCIYFLRKNISYSKAFLIKLFTITLWLNPLVFKYTRQSLWDLIKR